MSLSATPIVRSRTPTPRYRPASIAELADRARDDLWDPSKDVRHLLVTAQNHRAAGTGYVEAGDLEGAFVEYARAATIVVEKVPSHRDFCTSLTVDQRYNLALVSSPFIRNFSRSMQSVYLINRHILIIHLSISKLSVYLWDDY